MSITSLDILNLAHSLKDVSEVNCKDPGCLTPVLKVLLEYNLIRTNLEYAGQFKCQGEQARGKPSPTEGRALRREGEAEEVIALGVDGDR